jgi:hypothetical protein
MKHLLLFLILAYQLGAQVTGVTFDNISYSSWRMKMTVSSGNYTEVRFYYSVAPLSCTTVTAGVMIESKMYKVGLRDPLNYPYINTSGKVPDTLYNVCVQTLTGGTWTSAPMVQVRTLPAPAGIGYRMPPHAKMVDTSYPADLTDTNFTETHAVSADCTSFYSEFGAAVARQLTKNTIITLPLNACTGTLYLDQTPPDVKSLTGASIGGDGSITVTAHGWSDNQAITLARSSDYNGDIPNGILRIDGNNPPATRHHDGRLYYVKVKDANSFFLCATPPSQGGTNLALTSAGTGTFFLAAYPRQLKWIIVRTSTPDDQFVPVGVSLGAAGGLAWLPKMATFTNAILANRFRDGNQIISFRDSNNDGRRQSLLANVRFVGIVWTVADDPASHTTTDPLPWGFFLAYPPSLSGIIIDRCVFKTPSIQQRVYTVLSFQGIGNAVVHSWFDKTMAWFFPTNEGSVHQ